MDDLVSFYHQLADQFLELGTQGETEPALDEEELEKMRRNFSEDGPPFLPGECNVVTTYIPVEQPPLVNFLSETVETIIPLFPDSVPYYAVPPATYHISLVMVQDIRPEEMGNETMLNSALMPQDIENLCTTFTNAMEKRTPGKYDLRLYGIFFSPRDGAMLAAFVDDDQTDALRADIEDDLKDHLREESRKHKKAMVHITLLRPLAQFPRDLLRALQDKQRELFPLADAGLTLPVRQIALGRELRWMHSEVEDLEGATLR
jgi:hypothetical protein